LAVWGDGRNGGTRHLLCHRPRRRQVGLIGCPRLATRLDRATSDPDGHRRAEMLAYSARPLLRLF
jgi:hypothetical protein